MISKSHITFEILRADFVKRGIDHDTIEAFIKYFKENRPVWEHFQRIALEAAKMKFCYGAKAIMETVRFEIDRQRFGAGRKDQFKINNDWTSFYARAFVLCYPQLRNFLKFRKIRGIRRVQVEKGQQRLRFRSHRSRFRRAA